MSLRVPMWVRGTPGYQALRRALGRGPSPEEVALAEAEAIKDSFVGPCAVCGEHGRFVRGNYAISEGYRCPACIALVRYQGQARVLLDRYARHGATSFRDLVAEQEFRNLRIWEPGQLGPFRAYLAGHPKNETSRYWPDVPSGECRDGVRCQNLMALSFPSSSLDIVITSDVFEHVRRPFVGFSEIHRVLRSGGTHVFSIPGLWPLRRTTLSLVDVDNDEDVLLEEPKYHGNDLVYNEFGLDLLDRLDEIGFQTEVIRFACDNQSAARVVTFCSTKPAEGSGVAPL